MAGKGNNYEYLAKDVAKSYFFQNQNYYFGFDQNVFSNFVFVRSKKDYYNVDFQHLKKVISHSRPQSITKVLKVRIDVLSLMVSLVGFVYIF